MPEYLFPLRKEWKIKMLSNEESAQKALKEIIQVLRQRGFDMDSPYDFDNFVSDYCSHSQLFDTGMFQQEEDE